MQKLSYLKAVESAYQNAKKFNFRTAYPEIGHRLTVIDVEPDDRYELGKFQIFVENPGCSVRNANIYRKSILDHPAIWLVLPSSEYTDENARDYFWAASAGYLYEPGYDKEVIKSRRPFDRSGGDFFHPKVFTYDEAGALSEVEVVHQDNNAT